MTIPLAILAGGEGSRMGLPKAELRINGKPILEYLLHRLNWPGEKLLITAPGREHPPAHELFDREIPDPVSGEGPLRGIVTALEACPTAHAVLVLTCDMPNVTRAMLDHLCASLLARPDTHAVMTQRNSGIEPFPMALRPILGDTFIERLRNNARSLRSLASLPTIALIDPPADDDDSAWINLNSPRDVQRFTDRAEN